MTDYKFTQDWFSHNIPVWEQLKGLLPQGEERGFLEIGSFEGRSMVWTVENMMQDGDEIYCIDTWEGSEEHSAETVQGIEERFDHNATLLRDKFPEKWISKNKGTSTQSLACWLTGIDDDYDPTFDFFDFIYIDGSHTAKDVLTDACMAWPLLKQGGLMVFDDYLWGESRDILHRPKLATDFFVNVFAEGLDIVHIGRQFAVRKK
jgi:predicted O-methyltransferase YrrM